VAQPVGIVVQVLQRRTLGADVTAAQWIGVVTADVEDLRAARGDLEPARGSQSEQVR
jgi:hypothetical protein